MGLRRHQVENLIRRGPNFYWRARIPVGFEAAGKNTRLSLSLRLSDRKIASVVARRLNALLVEIELLPGARMATREQLAKIFALESEAVRAEIDNLDRGAKRLGSLRDPEQRDADRHVGYAYRLLEAYGPTGTLNFEPGSDAREALIEAGASEDDIPAIAETFRSESEGVRTDLRGQSRGRFLRDVLHRMAQVGLDDTGLNRDAASEEIFRARANAFLASADDPRKPSLHKLSRPQAPSPIEARAVAPPPQPQVMWTADAPSQTSSTPEQKSEIQTLPVTPIVDVSTSVRDPAAPGRTDLPLSRFDEEVDKMIANKGKEWTAETAADARVLVNLFRGILEEHGVTHSGQITQTHVAALRQHFNHIIPSWGRSPRLRALSTQALREESARIVAEQKAKGKPAELGLSGATIRRHLGNLTHFQTHLQASNYTIADWTLKSLRPRKPKRGDVRHQQVKPGPDQVRPLFDLPIFTGQLSADKPETPGELVFHSANYFLPMLFTYLGSRRNEFAGLMLHEIVQENGHWAINIKPNKYRTVKNTQSERMLPVPTELLRLNFLDYVTRLKELGHELLFPELYSPFRKTQDLGDRFYKDFVPIAKKCMPDELWQRPIHALRHGFADTLKQEGVSEGVIEDLSGRLGNTETATRYTNPAGLPLLQNILLKYPTITDHLEPRPIRLLPWVEQKLPPPWAGRKSGDRFGYKRGRRPKKSKG